MSNQEDAADKINQKEYQKWFEDQRDEDLEQQAKDSILQDALKNGYKVDVQKWGLQVELDDKTTKSLTDSVKSPIVDGLLAAVAAACPPLSIAIKLNIFVQSKIIQKFNKGNGVILTVTWVTPGLLIPKTR